jgi:hypothetical protein
MHVKNLAWHPPPAVVVVGRCSAVNFTGNLPWLIVCQLMEPRHPAHGARETRPGRPSGWAPLRPRAPRRRLSSLHPVDRQGHPHGTGTAPSPSRRAATWRGPAARVSFGGALARYDDGAAPDHAEAATGVRRRVPGRRGQRGMRPSPTTHARMNACVVRFDLRPSAPAPTPSRSLARPCGGDC